jgi:hypothetical protein
LPTRLSHFAADFAFACAGNAAHSLSPGGL